MISLDENALICDLAETYQIYDYKQLPVLMVAVFSCGLREDSRIKMLLSDQKVSLDTLLLAGVNDNLNLLLWLKTKDGQKGLNKPTLITDSLTTEPKKESKEVVFSSGEDFEWTRNEILKNMEFGGEK